MPIELIVVVTASLVGRLTVVFADLRTVGDIPTGLQAPQLPPLELLPLVTLHFALRHVSGLGGVGRVHQTFTRPTGIVRSDVVRSEQGSGERLTGSAAAGISSVG